MASPNANNKTTTNALFMWNILNEERALPKSKIGNRALWAACPHPENPRIHGNAH
jgi:hypothetical protein